MAPPTLSGALQGLKALGIDDRDRYKSAVEVGRKNGWAYYFPYLLTKNKRGRAAVYIGVDDGSLCLFQLAKGGGGPRMDLIFPPIPMNSAALKRSLERANDFNRDRSARVLRIDEADAAPLEALRSLRVRQRRAQYLFSPAAYEDLAGKALYTVRRNVALVTALPDVEVVPLIPEHVEACGTLLEEWRVAHRVAHGTAGGTGASKRALALVGRLPDADVRGEVVLIGGRVAAFAIGGEIRPGLACSFERKCHTAVRGLSYFHFRSFLLSLRAFPLVNDGSDARRAGLRQLKDSFRPVAMHAEYRASQRAATPTDPERTPFRP